jgi:beta-ribofuranosylaminobenzene 5'-phosphate synthase
MMDGRRTRIHVRGGSRLHFGMLPGKSRALDPSEPKNQQRSFGGIGLMISRPETHLTIETAPDWSVVGPRSDRALSYARTLTALLGLGPFAIEVCDMAPEHSGLGTGTQLAMGLAAGFVAALPREVPRPSLLSLGSELKRGNRSAIGIHGAIEGGLIVDGGRREKPAPLIARFAWPEDWAIVLVIPPGRTGRSGPEEIEAFERLADLPNNEARSDRLCRLVLRDILPALAEQDLATFGVALHEFNRLVGEQFGAVQGGIYGNGGLMDIVRFLQAHGGNGSGQSSWGSAVFTFVEGKEKAHRLCEQVRSNFSLDDTDLVVTGGLNRGIAVSVQALD